MNLNSTLDKFLKRTVWLWLPFYAFVVLTKEMFGRSDNK